MYLIEFRSNEKSCFAILDQVIIFHCIGRIRVLFRSGEIFCTFQVLWSLSFKSFSLFFFFLKTQKPIKNVKRDDSSILLQMKSLNKFLNNFKAQFLGRLSVQFRKPNSNNILIILELCKSENLLNIREFLISKLNKTFLYLQLDFFLILFFNQFFRLLKHALIAMLKIAQRIHSGNLRQLFCSLCGPSSFLLGGLLILCQHY